MIFVVISSAFEYKLVENGSYYEKYADAYDCRNVIE